MQLWRLNKVLQIRRTKVRITQVAWPAAVLSVLAVVQLIAFTVVAPLHWERVVIDTDSGESIARCDSDMFGDFIWPLSVTMLIPMVMTGVMAWKTHDVAASLSDAFWVGVLIMVQLEVRLEMTVFSFVNYVGLRVVRNCNLIFLFRLSPGCYFGFSCCLYSSRCK